MPYDRKAERRQLFLDYRDNFELEYEFTLMRLMPVIDWLETRQWPRDEPIPSWVTEFESLTQEAAVEKIRVRALAHAAADTILKAQRPDLDDPPPTDWLNLEPH